MTITPTAPLIHEKIGGVDRPLLLRNGEIERFEVQYAPFGFFELGDQLMGRGHPPQVRHVRDIIALGLVGGGMSDQAADRLIGSLGPGDNTTLQAIARRLVGVTLFPAILREDAPGKSDGSASGVESAPSDTMSAPSSATSAA